MNIVHISANAPYNDYWGYQDNLLPKFHAKLGHHVTVITTNKMHKDGQIVETDCADYLLDDGVRVIRKAYKQYWHPTLTGTLTHIPVYDLLLTLKPDFVFCHGLVTYTIFDVIKYKKKHQNCVIVQDNHLDYNIGNQVVTVKDRLIRLWLRLLNRCSIKSVDKVYGVTPWRKTYAEDYFGIPADKTDVLIMGADDEKLDLSHRKEIREKIRGKYNISEKDYLIVTGGKIDEKKKIDILLEAVAQMEQVKLIYFGNITQSLREKMEKLTRGAPNITYIGWIDSDQVYDYFFAADLVFFPGQHSVLWEQACASKAPCVFEQWEGMEHVNNGGNADFVENISVDNIKKKIKELLFTERYFEMRSIAESDATDVYLYSNIAEKSLECVINSGNSKQI